MGRSGRTAGEDEEAGVAKGQMRSNKEVRKPKKDKDAKAAAPATVPGKFASPQKDDKKK